MRTFIKLFALLLVLIPLSSQAQMEIDNVANRGNRKVSFADSIRIQKLSSVDYFSKAKYRYERQQIRKQRNMLQITSSLTGSMTSLNDSWVETSGGDNSITLLALVTLKHIYTKNLFSLTTAFSGKFGYYRVVLDKKQSDGTVDQVPTWYKNQDEVWLSVTPSIKMSDNWSYGATVKFRSQFADGYLSSGSQESYNLKSTFLSPGYLDISGGLIYKSPNKKWPFEVSLSPLALSAVYVTSDEVRLNAQYKYLAHTDANNQIYVEAYGVSQYEKSEYEGGSSIQVEYNKTFGKTKYLTYATTIHSFYGWMSQLTYKNIYATTDEYESALEDWNADRSETKPMLSIRPTVRWENKISIKATNLITTSISFQLYYNKAQNYSIQTQTLLSVGLAYTFKNK